MSLILCGWEGNFGQILNSWTVFDFTLFKNVATHATMPSHLYWYWQELMSCSREFPVLQWGLSVQSLHMIIKCAPHVHLYRNRYLLLKLTKWIQLKMELHSNCYSINVAVNCMCCNITYVYEWTDDSASLFEVLSVSNYLGDSPNGDGDGATSSAGTQLPKMLVRI